MARLREEGGNDLGNIDFKVVAGSPVEQIDQCVRAEGIDLIIISMHGHSGAKSALIEIAAEQMLRHATCPVLVVPQGIASKRTPSRK